MTVIRESGQHWKRILPHAILICDPDGLFTGIHDSCGQR